MKVIRLICAWCNEIKKIKLTWFRSTERLQLEVEQNWHKSKRRFPKPKLQREVCFQTEWNWRSCIKSMCRGSQPSYNFDIHIHHTGYPKRFVQWHWKWLLEPQQWTKSDHPLYTTAHMPRIINEHDNKMFEILDVFIIKVIFSIQL